MIVGRQLIINNYVIVVEEIHRLRARFKYALVGSAVRLTSFFLPEQSSRFGNFGESEQRIGQQRVRCWSVGETKSPIGDGQQRVRAVNGR